MYSASSKSSGVPSSIAAEETSSILSTLFSTTQPKSPKFTQRMNSHQTLKFLKDPINDPSLTMDYSFALEYKGPPPPFDIPKAVPIDIDQIPIASVATTEDIVSLPVVKPLNDIIASSSELNSSLVSDSDVEFDSSPSLGDVEEAEDDRRVAVVNFQDENANSSSFSSLSSGTRQQRHLKKSSCYRCEKGGFFTEKESCLVCDAKYCASCLLKAMGSMPEGRKCTTCIGKSIGDDAKRVKLGKSSRILKKLLSRREVEQVMKAEKWCEANQLRAEDVIVNLKRLSKEEMNVLVSCGGIGDKLKPGSYWYDKVSGFWGKEGHKPDKIITANLNVGGNLKENASNGDTGILINGREITKTEMHMLKSAGVQCAGKPHFWVDADGSYREEGQKNIKGNIWSKTRTKLLCSFLSLPVPCKGGTPSGEEVNHPIIGSFPSYFEQSMLQKFLLIGCDGSGTSTIFKQAKFLYENTPFSEEERQHIKLLIQSSIYSYLGILLEGREQFEEESLADMKIHSYAHSETGNSVPSECHDGTIYSISPRLKEFSDWLLKERALGRLEDIFLAATREYAPTVEELWKDAAIQATYKRRGELQSLSSSASYFLEKVVDISRAEYEPSNLDILHADGIISANGLACTEFNFPRTVSDGNNNDDDEQQDVLLRYQLIRLPTKGLGENCKWLDMFEDVRIVLFCVSLDDYDEYYEDVKGVRYNKMLESKHLFHNIITHPSFENMDFLLILNKFDLLEQKIKDSPLTQCDWFSDYDPTPGRRRSGEATDAEKAFHYIAVKFKNLFASITLTGRKLYVTKTKGLESDSIDAALRYAREILIWGDEKRPSMNEFSSFDPSSTYQ